MIDLHMHSTYSDGKDDLPALIDNVVSAGIDTFSITDHDTAMAHREIKNNKELLKKIKSLNLKLVTGVEFSCVYNGKKVHILAYDFDPFAKEVLFLEEKMSNLLKEKDKYRLSAIENAGYHLSEHSKAFLASRINIRKLDLANCLVDDGYFSNKDEAIQTFLKKIKYPSFFKLDAEEVIRSLTKIGAKTVWAHSLHGINEKPLSLSEVEVLATKFKEFGLAGLECYYSLYNSAEILGLKNIAKN